MLKGTSGDELRHWRMAPYLDAVLQQKRSRFMIRLSAQLLRWVIQTAQHVPMLSTTSMLTSAAHGNSSQACHR